MLRFALVLVVVALALLTADHAVALSIQPKRQTIELGQTAKISISSKARCRFISGLPRRQMSLRRRGKVWRITARPARVRIARLKFRCARSLLRALVIVVAAKEDGDPGPINNGGGNDDGLNPGLPGPSNPNNQPKSGSKLGTNLSEVSYWQGTVPFSNLVDQASDWLDPVNLRPDGWPASLPSGPASIVIAENSYPAGSYNVAWAGSGRFTVAGQNFSGNSGSGVISLDGSSLVLLTVSETDSNNPLRDISVTKSGEDGFFRSRFIEQLSPYGTLRFMDWQKTNGTFSDPVPALSCNNRTLDSSYSQGVRRGVSVEVMVALANLTGSDPWFTIPHTASDDFVRCHAQVVANNLRGDLRPRYEFSNETWNPTFEQYYALEDSSLGQGDAYLGLQRNHARRHKALMDLVDSILDRPFTRVLASQAANSWVLEQRLSFENTAASTDEVAIAPYLGLHDAFDPTEADRIARLSAAQLFTELRGKLASEVEPWIQSNLTAAQSFNKPLVSYEGGQHLAGDSSNNNLTNLFVAANRDSRMGELYDDYFASWNRLNGGQLFVHFTDAGPYSRFGSWGALESPDQSFASSPKYQALLRQAAR